MVPALLERRLTRPGCLALACVGAIAESSVLALRTLGSPALCACVPACTLGLHAFAASGLSGLSTLARARVFGYVSITAAGDEKLEMFARVSVGDVVFARVWSGTTLRFV